MKKISMRIIALILDIVVLIYTGIPDVRADKVSGFSSDTLTIAINADEATRKMLHDHNYWLLVRQTKTNNANGKVLTSFQRLRIVNNLSLSSDHDALVFNDFRDQSGAPSSFEFNKNNLFDVFLIKNGADTDYNNLNRTTLLYNNNSKTIDDLFTVSMLDYSITITLLEQPVNISQSTGFCVEDAGKNGALNENSFKVKLSQVIEGQSSELVSKSVMKTNPIELTANDGTSQTLNFDNVATFVKNSSQNDTGKDYWFLIEQVLPEGVTAENPIAGNIKYDTRKHWIKVSPVYNKDDKTISITKDPTPNAAGMDAVFTNELLGSIILQKSFEGHEAPEAYKLIASWSENGASRSREFSIGEETAGSGTENEPYTWTIDQLPIGTEIAIAEEGLAIEDYSQKSYFDGNEGAPEKIVAASNPALIQLKTVYTRDTGSVVVTALLSGINAVPDGFQITNDYQPDMILTPGNKKAGDGISYPFEWQIDDVPTKTEIIFTASGTDVTGYTLSPESREGLTKKSSPVIKGETQTVTFVNSYTRDQGRITLTLENEDGEAVPGAQFNFYRVRTAGAPNQKMNDTILTTDSSGKIVTGYLDPGSYYFHEINVPSGYAMPTEQNARSEEKTIEFGHSEVQELAVEMVNQREVNGTITLTLTNEDTPPIALPGAEFELYRNETESKEGGTKVNIGTRETNANGQIIVENLIPGYYYFVETKAPAGYLLPEGGAVKTELVQVLSGQATVQNYPVAMSNQREARGTITLTLKKGSSTGEVIPGATFELYRAADGAGSEAGAGNDTASGAENQDIKIEKSSLITNEQGQITVNDLEPGTYYFVEITVPSGYVLLQGDQARSEEVEIQPGESSVVTYTTTMTNQAEAKGKIILKLSEQNTSNGLPGAIFELYKKGAEETAYQLINQTLTTDADGKIAVDNLDPGSYYFRQISAPTGYVLLTGENAKSVVKTIESGHLEVQELSVSMSNQREATGTITLTLSNEDNPLIALPGAEFDLYRNDTESLECGTKVNTETLKTNASGQIIVENLIPGYYYFVEMKASVGYLLPEGDNAKTKSVHVLPGQAEKQSFQVEKSNSKEANGVVVLTLTDKNTSAALSDAEFDLYRKKDATDEDVTIVNESKLTTDPEGKIRIRNLVPGYYYFMETKAPAGYLLPEGDSAKTIPVHVLSGQSSVQNYPVAMSNQREANGNITLTLKKMESTDQVLSGATFELYRIAEENETGEEPGIACEKIETGPLVTNSIGQITVNDLDPGTYFFKEISAPSGYVLPEDGLEKSVQVIIMHGLAEITEFSVEMFNKQEKKGKAVLKVKGIQTEPLAGAEFYLYRVLWPASQTDADQQWPGEASLEDKPVNAEHLVSDGNGRIEVNNLEPGSYCFVQAKAPYGYKLPEEASRRSSVFRIPGGQDTIPRAEIVYVNTIQACGTVRVTARFIEIKAAPAEFQITNNYNDIVFTAGNAANYPTANGIDVPYEWVITDIPIGTIITFCASGDDATGYTMSEESVRERTKASHEVKENETQTVAFENSYIRDKGSAKVRTSFSGIDTIPADFRITNNYNSDVFTAENAGNHDTADGISIPFEWIIADVPTGTEMIFTVSGVAADGYSLSGVNSNGEVVKSVVITKDEQQVVTFENQYVQDVGDVQVTAKFIGIDTPPAAFRITNNYNQDAFTEDNADNHDAADGTQTAFEWSMKNVPVDREIIFTITGDEVEGYVLSEESINGREKKSQPVVKNETQTVVFEHHYSAESDGTFRLVLKDQKDQNVVLPGAKFDLYQKQKNGNPAQKKNTETLITDEQGKIVIPALKPGTYYFVEIAAPSGYVLPDGTEAKTAEFTVESGRTTAQELTVFMANQKEKKGKAVLTVRGAKGEPLAGAEFDLYRVNETEGQNETGQRTLRSGTGQGDQKINEEPLVADENGKLEVDELEPGQYYFVQVKAPLGYALPEGNEARSSEFTVAGGQNTVQTSELSFRNNIPVYGTIQITAMFEGVDLIPEGYVISGNYAGGVLLLPDEAYLGDGLASPLTWEMKDVPEGTTIVFEESGIEKEGYTLLQTGNNAGADEAARRREITVAEGIQYVTFVNVYEKKQTESGDNGTGEGGTDGSGENGENGSGQGDTGGNGENGGNGTGEGGTDGSGENGGNGSGEGGTGGNEENGENGGNGSGQGNTGENGENGGNGSGQGSAGGTGEESGENQGNNGESTTGQGTDDTETGSGNGSGTNTGSGTGTSGSGIGISGTGTGTAGTGTGTSGTGTGTVPASGQRQGSASKGTGTTTGSGITYDASRTAGTTPGRESNGGATAPAGTADGTARQNSNGKTGSGPEASGQKNEPEWIDQTVTLKVRKIWNDHNNRSGIRPESVRLTLWNQDGIVMYVLLFESSGWTATIVNLPGYTEDGRECLYYWTEEDHLGYVRGDTLQSGELTALISSLWERPAVAEGECPARIPGSRFMRNDEYHQPLGAGVQINNQGSEICFD